MVQIRNMAFPNGYSCRVIAAFTVFIVFILSFVAFLFDEIQTGIQCIIKANLSHLTSDTDCESLRANFPRQEFSEAMVMGMLIISLIPIYYFKKKDNTDQGNTNMSIVKILFKPFRILVNSSWALARLCFLIFAVTYYLIVICEDSSGVRSSTKKLILLPMDLVMWYILLLVFNINGPLTWMYRSSRPRWLVTCASVLLFGFGSMANVAEFGFVTIFITQTIWAKNTENLEWMHVVEVIGWTSTIALRLEFARFFWAMAVLSFKMKKYGIVNDHVTMRVIYDAHEEWESESEDDSAIPDCRASDSGINYSSPNDNISELEDDADERSRFLSHVA